MKTYTISICKLHDAPLSQPHNGCGCTHDQTIMAKRIEVTPTPPKPDECTCDPESIFADVDCPIHDPPPKPDEREKRPDIELGDYEALSALHQAEKERDEARIKVEKWRDRALPAEHERDEAVMQREATDLVYVRVCAESRELREALERARVNLEVLGQYVDGEWALELLSALKGETE